MRVPVLLALLLVTGAASADRVRHLLGEGLWAQKPTIPATLEERVEVAAEDYQQYAPVPRVAFFDIAYPASAAEYKDMAGHAVMLVTVLCQDAGELPPSRVFGIYEETSYPLAEIHASSTLTANDTLAAQVLGRNRWDALYLFPVFLARDRAEVLIDFAVNRNGFVIGRFSSKDLSRLRYEFSNEQPPVSAPTDEAILTLIQREFPGFLRGDT